MKSNHFKAALYAQVIWFIGATMFNTLSIMAIEGGQTGWAGPTPASSQLVATVMAAVIVLGFLAQRKAYLVAACLVLMLLAFGGVGRHVVADASTYASTATRVGAIGINLFGCWAFLAGIIHARKTD